MGNRGAKCRGENGEWTIAARSAAEKTEMDNRGAKRRGKIGNLTIVHWYFMEILAARIKSFIALFKLHISDPDLQLITSLNAIFKCTENPGRQLIN